MTVYRDAWHRRSIRLAGYDYASAGAYFMTLVTAHRECNLGEIRGSTVRQSEIGAIVEAEWQRTATIRAEVELDAFVVMPNHLHGIIVINDTAVGIPGVVGAHGRAPLRPSETPTVPSRPPRTIGSLMAGFKSAATKRINALRDTPGVPVWQGNYYERIIRNEAELNRIRQYSFDNPAYWASDPENPVAVAHD